MVTRVPTVATEVEPAWPEQALAEGRTGEVVLEVDISATGEVMDARVVQSAGEEFDRAALEAMRAFTFVPAEIDGAPAAVTIEYRFTFSFRPAPPPEDPAEGEAPVVNLRGTVLERGTRKPVVGAAVEVAPGDLFASTDAEGRFELAGVPSGEVQVSVLASGYRRYQTTETIEAGTITEVRYYLLKAIDSPFESIVTAPAEKKEVSTVEITVGEITRIPGVSGDTVKVVQNLPGVARSPFGSGLLIVRGGNPNDTKVYVDGQEVPLIFHFGGLTSVYASELVGATEFEAGNFGVRYGRAIAGRVELVTRDPNPDRFHLVADADLFDATAFVEGPLGGNVSGAVAARRSYVDAVLALAFAAVPELEPPTITVAPRYFDYQAKLAWKPSSKDRFRFDAYGSSDRLAAIGIDDADVDPVESFSTLTYFSRLQLTWDHEVSPDTRVRASFAPGFDRIEFEAPPLVFGVDAWRFNGRLDGYHDVSPVLTLGAGLDLLFSRQIVGIRLPQQTPPGRLPPPNFQERLVEADFGVFVNEPGVWVEAVIRPIPELKLIPGIRVDHNDYVGATWVDPRFAARWGLAEWTTVKGGIGLYHQAPLPQYVSEEFGNPDLGPEGSVQYMVGLEQRLTQEVALDLQLYWKTLFDLAVQVDGPERYAPAGGRAYGAELLVRYDPDSRFFGWLAYSVSRAERDQPETRFAATGDAYDQPHNVVALGSWAIPELWNGLTAGFRARFTTGNPRTQVLGGVYDVDADDYRRVPASVRELRLPDFFQLDLRVDKRWLFQESNLTAYVEVLNVTNNANPEGVANNYDFTEETFVNGIPLFPSIGLRFEY